MASTSSRSQHTCLHKLVLVDEVNVLGAVVSCVTCNLTFQMDEQNMEEFYYYFHHNSMHGPAEDLDCLIHHTLIKGK